MLMREEEKDCDDGSTSNCAAGNAAVLLEGHRDPPGDRGLRRPDRAGGRGAVRPARRGMVARCGGPGGGGGAQSAPPAERVAVFDNDGTLWCEKPMPIELGFILERLAAMVEENGDLRDKQPWAAAAGRDHAWLAATITDHYHGDDTKLKLL